MILNKGDCPADILAAVPPKTAAEKRLSIVLGLPFIFVMLFLPAYSTYSFNAHAGPGASFWLLFTHTIAVLAIPFFVDLVFLDWVLFCTITPSFVVFPGTEGFAGYKDYGFHLRAHARGSILLIASGLLIASAVKAF